MSHEQNHIQLFIAPSFKKSRWIILSNCPTLWTSLLKDTILSSTPMNLYLLATQLSTHIFFSKCNFDIPKCLLANPQSFLQPDPWFICWTFLSPQSHITSSNERKFLDHPTSNIFSWCCSPLTTHHSSSFNNLNISLSKHIYLLSLNITTFTLMKFYIANNNLHFLLLFLHEFTNTILPTLNTF
jgi:hypothetical protein